MMLRTDPRALPARWIKAGDEVAVYEVENGAGALDSGRRNFARTVEFAQRAVSCEWMLVVRVFMVHPPADLELRPAVVHDPGGWWSVAPAPDDFVPDEVDHVGATGIILLPTTAQNFGPPVLVYAGDEEQFVIRERVQVEAPRDAWLRGYRAGGENMRAVMSRPRTFMGNAEGQRHGAGATASAGNMPGAYGHSESIIAILRADTDEQSAIGDAAALAAIGVEPDIDGPGEDTRQLPIRRIPMGVVGQPLGRTVVESAAVNFTSERDSDDAEV
jgi:hypothetical protein